MKKTIKITSILCIIAIVCTVLLSSCGNSAKTAVSYEEYEIDSNMMKYFLSTQYNDFLNKHSIAYSQYANFLGYITFEQYMEQYIGFNPYEPLDEQTYGDGTDGVIKTWKDYFEEQTVKSIKQLLIYRAEAIKLGIELDENDQKKIDDQIEELLTELSKYYPEYPESKYFEFTYGKSVTKKDVRKAMELEAIATKAAEHIGDKIDSSITHAEIEQTYNENKLKFDLVDHLSYSFEVDYTDIIEEVAGEGKTAEKLTDEEKAQVNNKYKEEIKKAHDKAVELASVKTPEEFEKWVIEYTANKFYDEKFDSATSKLSDYEKPSTEDLTDIKAALIADVIKNVESGQRVDDEIYVSLSDGFESYVVYGKTVSKVFFDAIKSLKDSLYNTVIDEKDYCKCEKTNYVFPETNDDEEDKFSVWAFAADRKVNDIKNIEDGDGADGTELDTTKSLNKFTAEVSIIKKTAYKDETISRDVAYMIFTKEDMAKKAVEALKAANDLTKDKFLKAAEDKNNKADAYSAFEDYLIGNMQSEDFDNWLLSAKAGEITQTPIQMSDGSFMVAYYVGEGELKAWEYTVKGVIYEDDYAAYEDRMNKDYLLSIVVNNSVIDGISFGTPKETLWDSIINGFESLIYKIFGKEVSTTPPPSSAIVEKWGITFEESDIFIAPYDPDSADRYVVVNPNNAYVTEWGFIPSDGTIVNGSANSPSITPEITIPNEDVIIVKPITPSITPEVTIPNEDVIIINPSTSPSIETDIVVVPKVN